MSSDELTPDAPKPRLCHLFKWQDFDGYGFNLHAEKVKTGQYIGKIDENSPAESAGLKEGDRIIEVNGVNIANENHKQVVERIKAVPNETKLLVVDDEADDWYKERNIVIKNSLSTVIHLTTPVPRPTNKSTANGINSSVKEVEEDTQSQKSSASQDSSASSLKESPKVDVSASSIQESPKVDVYASSIQESPKVDVSASIIEESPKVDVSASSIEESPKVDVSASSIQESPKVNEVASSIQESPKVEVAPETTNQVEFNPAPKETPVSVSSTPASTPTTPDSPALTNGSSGLPALNTRPPPSNDNPTTPTSPTSNGSSTQPSPTSPSASNGSSTLSSPTSASNGLNLNMTAQELRMRLASRKKADPKQDNLDARKKYDIIQSM